MENLESKWMPDQKENSYSQGVELSWRHIGMFIAGKLLRRKPTIHLHLEFEGCITLLILNIKDIRDK